MEALENIKVLMSDLGWDHGGSPGSTKTDEVGRQIAKHGDATWIADMDRCIERKQAADALAEIKRREE